jgi:hypothetical protein
MGVYMDIPCSVFIYMWDIVIRSKQYIGRKKLLWIYISVGEIEMAAITAHEATPLIIRLCCRVQVGVALISRWFLHSIAIFQYFHWPTLHYSISILLFDPNLFLLCLLLIHILTNRVLFWFREVSTFSTECMGAWGSILVDGLPSGLERWVFCSGSHTIAHSLP